MSVRTMARSVLCLTFVAALAVTAKANDLPTAPAPRPGGTSFKLSPCVQLDFNFSPPQRESSPPKKGRIEFKIRLSPKKPIPHPVSEPANAPLPKPPCCAFDCQPAQAIVAAPPAPPSRSADSFSPPEGWSHGTFACGLTVLPPGPRRWNPAVDGMPPAIAAVIGDINPAFRQPSDRWHTSWIVCARSLGKVPSPGFHYLINDVKVVAQDADGNWWMKVEGVPQPKHARTPPRLRNYYGCRSGDVQIIGCPADECQQAVAPMPCQAARAPQEYPERYSHDTQQTVIAPFCQQVHNGAYAALIPQAECSGKLSGTWYRELDGIMIAATFSGKEMTLRTTQAGQDGNGKPVMVHFVITAECSVTDQGLVYGVVTSADVKTSGTKVAGGELLNGVSSYIQQAVNSPFAFRIKQTSAGMMVSDIKVAGSPGANGTGLEILGGVYTRSENGIVPKPKPNPAAPFIGMSLPSGRYLEYHSPQYYPPDPVQPLPREAEATVLPPPIAGPCQVCPSGPAIAVPAGAMSATQCTPCPVPQVTWQPTPSPHVPHAEFDMMADAFGQMMMAYQPPAPPPSYQLTPCPVQQAPQIIQVQSVVPPPPPGPPPGPQFVGTWVREVGPALYIVKFAHDHVTIKALITAHVSPTEVITQGLLLSGDYHMNRDGKTVVGLITGVDLILEGGLESGTQASMLENLSEELVQLQKAMTDQPFAMNVRVHGDELMLGNVRFPSPEDSSALTFLSVLGGQYKPHTGGPLPKPKPIKMENTGVTQSCCPSGTCAPAQAIQPTNVPPPPSYYPPATVPAGGMHAPGFSDVPPAPLQEPGSLAPQAQPTPYPAPSEYVAPPPPPPLPTQATPVEVEQPMKNKKKAKRRKAKRASKPEEPSINFEKSTDLRKIKDTWHRFWFPDQPSHLTPERIHGGIL